jgi:hypothetical protein
MESHLVESCSIFEVFPQNAKFLTFCGVSLLSTQTLLQKYCGWCSNKSSQTRMYINFYFHYWPTRLFLFMDGEAADTSVTHCTNDKMTKRNDWITRSRTTWNILVSVLCRRMNQCAEVLSHSDIQTARLVSKRRASY